MDVGDGCLDRWTIESYKIGFIAWGRQLMWDHIIHNMQVWKQKEFPYCERLVFNIGCGGDDSWWKMVALLQDYEQPQRVSS